MQHNIQFGKPAASNENAYLPIPEHLDLYRTFKRRESRRVNKSLDFSYGGTIYQVTDCQEPRRIMNQSVIIYTALDGKMWVEHQGKPLKISPYEEVKREPRELDRKQLDAWLDRKASMYAASPLKCPV